MQENDKYIQQEAERIQEEMMAEKAKDKRIPQWLIGYRISDPKNPDGALGDVYEMLVEVDEASPRDHYLFLYNVYEADEVPEPGDDVVEIQDTQVAKVVGFFSPTTWVFAVRDETIISNELFG